MSRSAPSNATLGRRRRGGHGARAVPRLGLGSGRGTGRLWRGRLLRQRDAHDAQLLRLDVPALQRRLHAIISGRERRVRLPGAAQHLRVRRRRAGQDRVLRCTRPSWRTSRAGRRFGWRTGRSRAEGSRRGGGWPDAASLTLST